VFATYADDWRPNGKLRINTQYQLRSYERRSDGSTGGVHRIPRLTVEYQVSRPIFLRVIGEYDSRTQDALRDDSRTGLPILIRDPATGLYAPSTAFERHRFRVDTLLLSADAGHRGVRRLQQPSDGTGRPPIR
jgi:hypothetical protein